MAASLSSAPSGRVRWRETRVTHLELTSLSVCRVHRPIAAALTLQSTRSTAAPHEPRSISASQQRDRRQHETRFELSHPQQQHHAQPTGACSQHEQQQLQSRSTGIGHSILRASSIAACAHRASGFATHRSELVDCCRGPITREPGGVHAWITSSIQQHTQSPFE